MKKLFILLQLLGLAGCTQTERGVPVGMDSLTQDQQQRVTAFCADCHRMPEPEFFTKDQWPAEVYRGYRFYIESGRSDLHPPAQDVVIKYFQERAPVVIPTRDRTFVVDIASRFLLSRIAPPELNQSAVSHISLRQMHGRNRLVFSDMLSGLVREWDWNSESYRSLANISHPAGMDWCDLNNDGMADLLVSDLGSFQPQDHTQGGVFWLQQRPDGEFTKHLISGQLGRVSDVRATDVDEDGRLDILVAEFGWQKTGRILLLKQVQQENSGIEFQSQVIDERHGTINTQPIDLDHDGDNDFVALISQEHEAVEVFLNDGTGEFKPTPLCPPADPAYGSSGLSPADLDGDGDVDFLVTNGDMFDSFFIKPYHSIRWLENSGNLKFVSHHIANVPGAHGASAADLDLDGDLDIVTAAFFPATLVSNMAASARDQIVSAVWFEQTAPGIFQPHVLEYGTPAHACHLLADIDADGDQDVILGNFFATSDAGAPFTIFENQTR